MTTETFEQMADSLIIRPELETESEDVTADTQPEPEEIEGDDEDVTTETEAEDGEEVETDEPTEQEEADEAPSKFRVKVDGEEVEVTLEELTRSYSGQGKIQKGMQEAAAARKQAEAFTQELQTMQRQVLEAAQSLQADGIKPMPKAPDPALATTDFVKYTKERAKYEVDVASYQQQQAQIAQVRQAYNAQEAQRQIAEVEANRAKLAELIPEFANPETAAPLIEKLVKGGSDFYGYSVAELQGVTDARAINTLNDALKWRALQSGTAKAKAEKRPPVTMKPAASRPEPEQLARAKLAARAKKSGSTDDWAAAILEPRRL